MIRAKHAKEEIEKAREGVKTVFERIVVKLFEVVIKLLLDIRLNGAKIMEKLGISKVEPRKPQVADEEPKKEDK